ncbi:MAG: shikimate kinase [Flavobacteriales bacterium]
MPGSGKSRVAKKLANMLCIPFQDSDIYIEEKEGKRIHEIFSEKGEQYFRDMEWTWVNNPHPAGVYATGGGLPCHNHAVDVLLHKGTVVYLQASEVVLKQRISQNSSRPMFSGLEENEVLDFLKNLLKQRKQYYQKANFCINVEGKNEEDIVKEIISLI